jgi:hypothetical protein
MPLTVSCASCRRFRFGADFLASPLKRERTKLRGGTTFGLALHEALTFPLSLAKGDATKTRTAGGNWVKLHIPAANWPPLPFAIK